MSNKSEPQEAPNNNGPELHDILKGDGDAGASSDPETTPREEVEVLFEGQSTQRRRASRTSQCSGPQSLSSVRDPGSCLVHNLLQAQNRSSVDLGEGVPSDKHSEQTRREQNQTEEAHGNDDGHNHVQSRLLTKKQLRDMAIGIRELSQQLGRLRVVLKIRNVFILTKAHDRKLIKKSRAVSEWLLAQRNRDDHQYHVWVEDTMRDDKDFDAAGLVGQDPSFHEHLHYWDKELCERKPHTFEICLALGGDGTVLYASWLFQRVVPPVMSFALGSLGFLTKFDYDRHQDILTRSFADGVTVSLRLRFEVTIMRSSANQKHDKNGEQGCSTCNDADAGERDLVEELIGAGSDDPSTHAPDLGTHNILNDIVLDRGPNGTMTTLEVFGDNQHFTTVQADGICVATPTGSTAYNLAAGGSLCHPDNPVILVTAIAPHTLSFRPIILPDTVVLRVGVPYDARASCWASFDGKERSELCPGDYVTISASRFPFPTVLPLDSNSEEWVSSISRTLNWNNRQRQKTFDEK